MSIIVALFTAEIRKRLEEIKKKTHSIIARGGTPHSHYNTYETAEGSVCAGMTSQMYAVMTSQIAPALT